MANHVIHSTIAVALNHARAGQQLIGPTLMSRRD
jgi:hypothetical protein